MNLRPDRLPSALRFAAYGTAVAILLYLTQAPDHDLPQASVWDKAEHSISWLVLTGVGLAFWPERPGRITAFAFFFGALVEVLQATLPFGRDGDLRDLFADSVGILAALVIWALVRRLARRWPLQALMAPDGRAVGRPGYDGGRLRCVSC